MRLYRLWLAYSWEKEAFKLEGGKESVKVRKGVEQYFLAHLKAACPKKYQKQLTPNYPVRYSNPLGD